MRQYRWTIIVIALLLSGCGGAQQAEQPTAAPAPTAVPATALAAPTDAPTAAPAAPTAAPAPTASAESPTAEPLPAGPTAPLILQPTAKPGANAQSAPTSAPAAGNPTAASQATKPTAAQPAASNDEQGQPGEPARIVIAAVGIDQKIVSVGLDKDRVPIVPDHNVGWYNFSSELGQGDNVVLWGHVLRFTQAPKIPAPFARLKEVKPGAKVILYDQSGNAHNYVVKQQIWVKPDEVAYILPQGKEMVTMVSCIGDKVISDGEVVDESHRLITIAEPTDG